MLKFSETVQSVSLFVAILYTVCKFQNNTLNYNFTLHFQAQENVDPSWVRIWLLDMALAGNGKVAILMAAHNPNISQQLHYAIGIIIYNTL